jgi:hypothetical protein
MLFCQLGQADALQNSCDGLAIRVGNQVVPDSSFNFYYSSSTRQFTLRCNTSGIPLEFLFYFVNQMLKTKRVATTALIILAP